MTQSRVKTIMKIPFLSSHGILLHALLLIACGFGFRVEAQPEPPPMRLYAIDCGQLDYSNMDGFSNTDDYAGERGSLVVPCFLLRHGGEWMLWDTGVGDRIAELPSGEVKQGARFLLRRTLASQLSQTGLTPDDIKYVGLSHLHSDHSRNIGLFPHSVLLLAAPELPWAKSLPTPEGVEAALIAPLDNDRVQTFDKDLDVFGDGTVRIVKAPGHTPGHCMLLVKLPKSGPILITADLFHQRRSLKERLVPRVNVSRADTVASMNRLSGISKATGARVIISHEGRDFETLTAFRVSLNEVVVAAMVT